MLTLDEVRRQGLLALREKLGRAGLIRFLSQYENGEGDYAKHRREWVDRTALEDIRRESQQIRGRETRKKKS